MVGGRWHLGRDLGGASRAGDPAIIIAVKAVHTAIFGVELPSIAWLVVSGLIGRRDRTVALAAGAVAIEGAAFLTNDRVCPLTPLTERLGASHGQVSDIFLPGAVARTIPIWSSGLVAFAILLHVRNALQHRGTRERRRDSTLGPDDVVPDRRSAGLSTSDLNRSAP